MRNYKDEFTIQAKTNNTYCKFACIHAHKIMRVLSVPAAHFNIPFLPGNYTLGMYQELIVSNVHPRIILCVCDASLCSSKRGYRLAAKPRPSLYTTGQPLAACTCSSASITL